MKISLRAITEMSVAVALAVIFNFMPLWKMPQGGSISLEMLPILFIALRWGLKEGLLAGFVYGMLQLAFNPFIVHPIQMVLDYPLPYMLLGFSGVFKEQAEKYKNKKINFYIISALLLGGSLRLVSHILSGAVFFAQYAPEGTNIWIYSIVYNASFIIPSLIVCYVIIEMLKNKILYI
ncbi:MAG: energy-coupled thiamine transporter ThiT [Halanaerobiales bacterium]